MPSDYCILEMEGFKCAVEMPALNEVVVCPPVTYFPGGPSCLIGVVNLRGDVFPLFQLETVVGVPAAGGQETSIAVLKEGETVAAFPIRHVHTVSLERDGIGPHPAGSSKPVFLGRFMKEESEIVLLDVPELMKLLARRMEESKSAISAPSTSTVNA